MAELFAPFSKVAAKNPFSSSPVERSVEEIETVTDDNRMICDPYPRLMVARDQVNMGAAALLMSVAAARKLGVPEGKWVYLRGHADMKGQDAVGERLHRCVAELHPGDPAFPLYGDEHLRSASPQGGGID